MGMELDDLFAIAEAEPLLGRIEVSLRQAGQPAMADQLLKLQQDVGLEIDREMGGASGDTPPVGPQTAQLAKAYEPVTVERVSRILWELSFFAKDLAFTEFKKSLSIPSWETMGAGKGTAPVAGKKGR